MRWQPLAEVTDAFSQIAVQASLLHCALPFVLGSRTRRCYTGRRLLSAWLGCTGEEAADIYGVILVGQAASGPSSRRGAVGAREGEMVNPQHHTHTIQLYHAEIPARQMSGVFVQIRTKNLNNWS